MISRLLISRRGRVATGRVLQQQGVCLLRRLSSSDAVTSTDSPVAEEVKFQFRVKGELVDVVGKVGGNLLRTAQAHDVPLEGACEGVCACSTCHVILDDDLFDTLDEASEDEEDMLDMAFGLTDTSRLGCQVRISKEAFEGTIIDLPAATRNFYVDGHVPQPH